MAKNKERAPISVDPDDAEVGGLLNDCVVTVEAAEWTSEPPTGYTSDRAGVFLHLDLVPESGEASSQHWSAGRADRFEPSEDGQYLLPAEGTSAKGLSNSCNAFLFMDSLKRAGFPMDRINEEGIGVLVGLEFLLVRKPQPKRSGLPTQEGERERTFAACEEIQKYPWDKGGKKGVKKAKPADDDDEDPEEDEDTVEVTPAQKAVMDLLAKSDDGTVPKANLANMLLKALNGNPKRKAILSEAQEDEFLLAGVEAKLWAVDKRNIIGRG